MIDNVHKFLCLKSVFTCAWVCASSCPCNVCLKKPRVSNTLLPSQIHNPIFFLSCCFLSHLFHAMSHFYQAKQSHNFIPSHTFILPPLQSFRVSDTFFHSHYVSYSLSLSYCHTFCHCCIVYHSHTFILSHILSHYFLHLSAISPNSFTIFPLFHTSILTFSHITHDLSHLFLTTSPTQPLLSRTPDSFSLLSGKFHTVLRMSHSLFLLLLSSPLVGS